ncbi:MAG: hypothetical protein WA093_00255 [Minisyncoccales bacterium]
MQGGEKAVDNDCPGDLLLGNRGEKFKEYAARADARDQQGGCRPEPF